MKYLDFLYFGKENVSRIYDVCKVFYSAEKQDKPSYFVDLKKTLEKLNLLLLFSPNMKVQQA